MASYDPGPVPVPPGGPGGDPWGTMDGHEKALWRKRFADEGRPLTREMMNQDELRADDAATHAAAGGKAEERPIAYLPGAGNFWLGQQQGFADQLADQYRGQGANLLRSGQNAQGRQTALPDLNRANRSYPDAWAARQAGSDIRDDVRQLATANQVGPTAAQQQATAGGQQNANTAVSVAQVGGGNAVSARRAGFDAARAQGQAAGQAGIIGAQEEQQRRAFAGQAAGQLGAMDSRQLGMDLQERQQDIGFARGQAGIQAGDRANNDAMTLGLGGLALGSQGQAAGVNAEQLGAWNTLENMRANNWTTGMLQQQGINMAQEAASAQALGSGIGGVTQVLDALRKQQQGTATTPTATPTATPPPTNPGGGLKAFAPTQPTEARGAQSADYSSGNPASEDAQQRAATPPVASATPPVASATPPVASAAPEPPPPPPGPTERPEPTAEQIKRLGQGIGGMLGAGGGTPPPPPQPGDQLDQRRDPKWATPWNENPANFWLGGKEDFARQQADALRQQGGNFFAQAATAQGRDAPQINQFAGDRAAEQMREGRNGINDATGQLRALAAQGPGASAAQGQMRQGQDSAAMSAINSAAAGGGGTSSLYGAGQQALSQGGAVNAAAASARAGETDAYRNMQLGNLSSANNLQQGLRQHGLSQRGQDFDMEQQNALLRQQNSAQGDRFSLGLGALGLQSQQLGGRIDSVQLQSLMGQEALRSRTKMAVHAANLEAAQRRKAADAGMWSAILGGAGTLVGGLAGGPPGAVAGGIVGSHIGGEIEGGYAAAPPYQSAPYQQPAPYQQRSTSFRDPNYGQ